MKLLSATILFVVFIGGAVLGQEPAPAQKPKPPAPASLAKDDDGSSAPVRSAAEKYFSDVELIDLAVRTTVTRGGTVYVIHRDHMPCDGPVAALFRF